MCSSDLEAVPAEFQSMAGNVSATTIAKLKEFVQQGGRLVAIGPSSINAAQQFGFPVTNHLVERTPTGTTGTPLPGEKFYVPGSILEVAYDTATTATRGQEARGPVFFDNSPVMRLGPDAALKGVKALAWYDNPSPLKSGWAWARTTSKAAWPWRRASTARAPCTCSARRSPSAPSPPRRSSSCSTRSWVTAGRTSCRKPSLQYRNTGRAEAPSLRPSCIYDYRFRLACLRVFRITAVRVGLLLKCAPQGTCRA